MPGPISPKAVVGTGTGNPLTIYTAPVGGAVLSLVQLTNDTAAALSGRVRIVPAADVGSVGAKHVVVPLTSVAAGDYVEKSGGMSLAQGAVVIAEADAGLVVTVFGTEIGA